jgi:hypothetical protein
MNKLMIFAFLAFAAISCKSDRELFPEDTTIEGEFVYDFGEVVQGEIVKARFELKNTGKVQLKIFSAKPTCGCTVADYSQDPIDQGKFAWVEAEIDTKELGGDIAKSVRVTANTLPTDISLTVKGKVMPKF